MASSFHCLSLARPPSHTFRHLPFRSCSVSRLLTPNCRYLSCLLYLSRLPVVKAWPVSQAPPRILCILVQMQPKGTSNRTSNSNCTCLQNTQTSKLQTVLSANRRRSLFSPSLSLSRILPLLRSLHFVVLVTVPYIHLQIKSHIQKVNMQKRQELHRLNIVFSVQVLRCGINIT